MGYRIKPETAKSALELGLINQEQFQSLAVPEPDSNVLMSEPPPPTPPSGESDMALAAKSPPPASAPQKPAAGASGSWDEPPPVQLASDVSPGQAKRPRYDVMGGTMGGYSKIAHGVQEAAAAGQKKAIEEAAYLDQVVTENERQIKEERERRLQQQEVIDDTHRKYTEAVDGFSQKKLDPNRLFANQTTGDKILAGIAIFFGAAGSGDKNKAMEAIDRAIENDINLQKSQLTLESQNLEKQRGILSDMYKKFENENTASAAARAAYLDNAQLRIKSIAAKYAGTEIAAKAEQLLGEIQIKKSAAYAQVEQAELARTPGHVSSKNRDLLVPGYEGFALSAESAKQLRVKVGETKAANAGIDELLQINKNLGKSASPELRAKADTLVQGLIGTLRVALTGPGPLNEQEMVMMKDIIANPTSLLSLDKSNEVKLKTLKGILQKKLDYAAMAEGLTTPQVRLGITER